MVNDLLSMRGDVVIKLNDEVVLEKKNLIVTAGKAFLANAIINSSASPFTNMAVGTGTTAAAVGDTALGSELARSAYTSSSVASNVVSLSTTYAAGTATGALTEAGIFNAGSGGTMLSRVVFSAINKGSADSLTISWTITVG
jgi:hypothetical protein